MSKKYRGKPCVYCGTAEADTGDHVFARQFFLERDRAYLPKVPACRQCNGEKSELEHYAATVLPFGGRHSRALPNLKDMVPKRLKKNAKLEREISAGVKPAWAMENGSYHQTTAVPVDGQRVHSLMEYVARGLVWHHFNTLIEPDDLVIATTLNAHGEQLFMDRLDQADSDQFVERALGGDTVVYQGLQAHDSPHVTLWRIRMYGGMWLLSDHDAPNPSGSSFGVMTAPPGYATAIGT